VGRSLLEVAGGGERALFSCQVDKDEAQGLSLGVARGEHKLLGECATLDGALSWKEAFDLARDPQEKESILGGAAPWSSELAREGSAAAESLRRPWAASLTFELDPSKVDELRGLGYGGEHEDAEEHGQKTNGQPAGGGR